MGGSEAAGAKAWPDTVVMRDGAQEKQTLTYSCI